LRRPNAAHRRYSSASIFSVPRAETFADSLTSSGARFCTQSSSRPPTCSWYTRTATASRSSKGGTREWNDRTPAQLSGVKDWPPGPPPDACSACSANCNSCAVDPSGCRAGFWWVFGRLSLGMPQQSSLPALDGVLRRRQLCDTPSGNVGGSKCAREPARVSMALISRLPHRFICLCQILHRS
jgi:hypothetical protein